MYNPVTTYRVQFHKDFNFAKFHGIISYLSRLGISTIYASPVFESTPGSTHGYDGLNPHRINPEIGTEIQFTNINKKLQEQGIGWLQDIVPNHMAFDTRNNWLMDTLEKGIRSQYATFFDIDWNSPVYNGRVMVPFLGASMEQTIRNGDLKINYQDGRLLFAYYNSVYPLSLRSYITVLSAGRTDISNDTRKLIEQILAVEKIEEPALYEEEWNTCVQAVNKFMASPDNRSCIDSVNNNEDLLMQLANDQHYRFVQWQETDGRINYRRFFTVNGLICLNMEKPRVFHRFHTYIKLLLEQGMIDGLRIDHIDGLYDPGLYLDQLKELSGEQGYIIVEKILVPKEKLPEDWKVQGTSGYEFLAMVNNLFTNANAELQFTQFYQNLSGDSVPIKQQMGEKKSYILHHHMGGELENLYQLFMHLVTKEDYAEMRTEDIKTVIGEFLIHCPVYRFYGNKLPFGEQDLSLIKNVLNSVRESRPDLSSALNLMDRVFHLNLQLPLTDKNELILHFYKRCMQFSGPLMAKGVEDTLMYTYNRFIAHNDVGDSPESFGCSLKEFHELMEDRQSKWPLSLNATSTHDTKRGEDVRARLNILTELSTEWISKINEWHAMRSSAKINSPDANDEYFIYQTLIGSYPLNDEHEKKYAPRLEEYLQKALREGKRHSNWTSPNEKYESATKEFAVSLLEKDKPFWKSFEPFHQQVADFGITNSLVQLILKFTCPGIPDTYQGTELWDLSLVDPDNRRPVDYNLRESILNQLKNEEGNKEFLNDLWTTRFDARLKLWLTHRLLKLRSENKNLFVDGSYLPLKTKGRFKDKILAFARVSGTNAIIVVVPVQIASLCTAQHSDAKHLNWKDTRVVLPARFKGDFTNIISGNPGTAGAELKVQEIFSDLPFALIEATLGEHERNAGVLLHISSLASPYGVGDLGPGAKAFADFLIRTGQRYWQLLPVNPTEAGQGHSPYSAVSSRAGNILFISPDVLFSQGLLNENDLIQNRMLSVAKADYQSAEKIRKDLFNKAWQNFKDSKNEPMQTEYEKFCDAEKEWLDDFAFYLLLKQFNEGKPWYEWVDEYKSREQRSMKRLADEYQDQLAAIKWLQFIFRQQWNDLKEYCNSHGLLLIGDLPFYVSYDSADVWSHPQLFSLDGEGNRIGVAGVPPDAFSADGQLWGMPVFRWDVLKELGYSWWIERLRSNRKLFDLVRLDHFRAFAGYWEVPASESTARNGEWKVGPGSDFLRTVKEKLGELPFVAEDLGDIDENVLNLRDEFNLPGMKVLQFAFGDDFYESDYIPHNYDQHFVVYTGTHDNNTTLGWYRTEADDEVKQRVEKYLGSCFTDAEIAGAFCRLAMASVAKTVILPIQDILGLDENARMNTPSVAEKNWSWRLLPGQIDEKAEQTLLEWTILYNRKR
ncbi:MAG TPA: malto-oligosyltrehalose synthase [Flavitalea sp.]|nr:malto-oligosyltrehalose synthase [Flavitalea sp.]